MNASFEDYSICPTSEDQVSNSVGWLGFGSPDYFNACATGFGVPYNWGGYQQAASGNAYCALGTYGDFASMVREFILGELSDSLIVGQKYYASFKINLCFSDSIFANTANNMIGCLFTTQPFSYFGTNSLPNFAHVYTANIITDTLNWTTVSGSFVADSSYKYISIGTFFEDSQIDTSIIMYDPIYQFAYYYLDDICVSMDSLVCFNGEDTSASDLINSINFPNVFTPNNDGINDLFSFNNSNITELNCTILNRWGNIVGVIQDINGSWNGSSPEGIPCSEGVYFYTIRYKTIQGDTNSYSGQITLQR